MTVRCLTTGRVRAKTGERGLARYVADSWRAETMPVHAFLVWHERGVCLFDTGQTPAAAKPGFFPRWHPFFRLARFELGPTDALAARLAGHGVQPAEVRWVVLSHLHTDHVGGVEACPEAQILVSRREWSQARGIGGHLRGYLPHHWPRSLTPRLLDLDENPTGPFSGSYDIAGDDDLLVVPLPGHTRGHVGLLVRDEDGSVLLAGDAAHRATELARTQPAVAAWCAHEGVLVATAHDDAAPALLAAREGRASTETGRVPQ